MRLLAGTRHGLYELEERLPRRLVGGDVTAVAVDGPWAWLIVDGTSVLRADLTGVLGGHGDADEVGADSVAGSERRLHCLLVTPDGLLVGTAEAGLERLRDATLEPVTAFDHVDGRERWSTPWGAPPDTRWMAAGPDGALYVNVHVGGIVRSDDGGATWRPTIEVAADVHQVTVADGLVLAAAARGLAVSADRGETWSWRTEGLHARYARAVTVAGDRVLVSVSEGPGGADAAIYQGRLGTEGPLHRCRTGLPPAFGDNIDTGCLVAAGAQVAVADAGSVFVSADAGDSWEALETDLPAIRCLAVLEPPPSADSGQQAEPS